MRELTEKETMALVFLIEGIKVQEARLNAVHATICFAGNISDGRFMGEIEMHERRLLYQMYMAKFNIENIIKPPLQMIVPMAEVMSGSPLWERRTHFPGEWGALHDEKEPGLRIREVEPEEKQS